MVGECCDYPAWRAADTWHTDKDTPSNRSIHPLLRRHHPRETPDQETPMLVQKDFLCADLLQLHYLDLSGFLDAGGYVIHRTRHNLTHFLLCLSLIGLLISSCSSIEARNTITGIVVDEHGPVAGAVVRAQTTENNTVTDIDGSFLLSELNPDQIITVTAWKSGYYIAGAQEILPGSKDIIIHLEAHSDADNPDYLWLPSQYHPGEGEDQGCDECHSNKNTNISYDLPVDEWLLDAHLQSAENPTFNDVQWDRYARQSESTHPVCL